MKLKTFPTCFAILLIIGVTAVTTRAQPTNSPRRDFPAGERPFQQAGGPAGPFAGMGPVMNVLTEEQRASLTQSIQAQREKVRELETKLRSARQELATAGLDGKFDEDSVRKQAAAVANLEADMAVLRVKAISQIQPPLSPEQIEKIKSSAPALPFRGAGLRGGQPAPANPPRRSSLMSTNRDENDLPMKQ
jgi:Spy/CpxP family protein refolding chaperone